MRDDWPFDFSKTKWDTLLVGVRHITQQSMIQYCTDSVVNYGYLSINDSDLARVVQLI